MNPLNTGKLVSNIKSGYSYYDKRQELEAMGVVFKITGLSSITDFDFDSVLLALNVYKVSELYSILVDQGCR